MPQFFAYVYTERHGYRVFLEGLGDLHATSLVDAERQARRLVRRSVFASYPDRLGRSDTAASRTIALEIRIIRVRGPPPTTTPFAPPSEGPPPLNDRKEARERSTRAAPLGPGTRRGRRR